MGVCQQVLSHKRPNDKKAETSSALEEKSGRYSYLRSVGNAVVRNNKNNSDVRKSVDRIRNNDMEGPLAVNRNPDLLVESLK